MTPLFPRSKLQAEQFETLIEGFAAFASAAETARHARVSDKTARAIFAGFRQRLLFDPVFKRYRGETPMDGLAANAAFSKAAYACLMNCPARLDNTIMLGPEHRPHRWSGVSATSFQQLPCRQPCDVRLSTRLHVDAQRLLHRKIAIQGKISPDKFSEHLIECIIRSNVERSWHFQKTPGLDVLLRESLQARPFALR